MRILVLVIASHNKSEYLQMESIWKSRVVPDWCDMWLVHSKPVNQWIGDLVNDSDLDPANVEVDIKNKTLYIQQDECLIPGILAKTVKALKFCLLNGNYNYVWRTNLSSVLNFYGLYNYCASAKPTGFYGGYIGKYNTLLFASGAGFLMSCDVAQWLVANQHLLQWNIIDDVAIGILLEPQFSIVHIERQWIQSMDEFIRNDVFHYRCESYLHLNTVQYMNHTLRNIIS